MASKVTGFRATKTDGDGRCDRCTEVKRHVVVLRMFYRDLVEAIVLCPSCLAYIVEEQTNFKVIRHH